MTTGEQLSAYLAGELDAEEREAVEAALERDPDLRARLERLRAADEALGALPPVTPPDGFSEQLHATLDRQVLGGAAADELSARRDRRLDAFRPLAVAAAAAAVIALFGVAGVWLLQGGGGDGAETASAPMAGGAGMDADGIPVVETDNDFDEQELHRLAVNVEFSGLVPRDLPAPAATPLAEELQEELYAFSASRDMAAEPDAEGQEDALGDGTATLERNQAGEADEASTGDVVARCLPSVLEGADSALIPVYVELARFDGEAAVLYTLVSEDPDSGAYRRVQVWALARSDCQVLGFAQYDRE